MNDVECRWCTLPETNSEFFSENGWLEDDFFSFWDIILSGAMFVSARVISE